MNKTIKMLAAAALALGAAASHAADVYFDAAPNYYGKSTTDWVTWSNSTIAAIEGGTFVNMQNGTDASKLGTNHFVAADGFVWGAPTTPNGAYDQGRGLTTIYRFADTQLSAMLTQGVSITENFAGESFTKVFGVNTAPGSWQLVQGGDDVFAFVRAGWNADNNGSSDADLASILASFTDVETFISVGGQQVASATAIYDAAGTVPEPASIALVGAALAGLGFARRRKA